jgi:hypothetical protein
LFCFYFADQLPLCIVVQDGLEQLKTQKQFITQNHPSRIVQKCWAEEADERTLDKNTAAIDIVLLRAQLMKNSPAALLSASEYAWMRGCRRHCTHKEEDMRQVLC